MRGHKLAHENTVKYSIIRTGIMIIVHSPSSLQTPMKLISCRRVRLVDSSYHYQPQRLPSVDPVPPTPSLQQASFVYHFQPSESFYARPFGLTMNIYYRDLVSSCAAAHNLLSAATTMFLWQQKIALVLQLLT